MRKLASVQVVEEVAPIEGADMIEKIRIKGWWVVTKKDQFKVGDPCIYYEIDSLLPDIPQYSFLSKGNKIKKTILDNGVVVEGWRLKTVRLRGQVSQGLALPLSDFPFLPTTIVGTDLSADLQVYKFDPPLPASLAGEAKGLFPGYVPKTDEDRIQGMPEMLEKYRGQRFYRTSKIDGTSCTVLKYDNELNVCGRKLNYIESPNNTMWRLAIKYNLKEKLPNNFAIQSECAGEGIQKNRHVLKGIDLYAFYVFDIEKNQYLKLNDMIHFVKDLGMKTVPIIEDNFILNHTMDEILALANAPCPFNPNVPQEGTVFRLYDSTEKISFKAISNEYLLKYGL